MELIDDHREEAINAMRSGILVGLEAAALQAESYAKLELENDPRRIDTGNLRNSINHTVDSSEPAAYIGTNVEYGIYVHEGTSRMKPNRFLRNAVEKNGKQLIQIIKDATNH